MNEMAKFDTLKWLKTMHTLKGKHITIPLRANPKQANPDLLELPKEIDPRASNAVLDNTEECTINQWMTEGKLYEETGRRIGCDLLVDCFTLLLIFWGKSDIPKTNIYSQF